MQAEWEKEKEIGERNCGGDATRKRGWIFSISCFSALLKLERFSNMLPQIKRYEKDIFSFCSGNRVNGLRRQQQL